MADIVNQVDGKVQVIFSRSGDYGTFRDALWMTQEQYDSTSADVLEAMKDERYANWLAIVTAPPQE